MPPYNRRNMVGVSQPNYHKILSIRTYRCEQTVQTRIRLFLKEESYQDLHLIRTFSDVEKDLLFSYLVALTT